MWKLIAKIIFKVSGWKIDLGDHTPKKRAVMIAAPHTSNWDFVYARAAFFLMDIPVRYTIKKEWINGLMGPLLRSLGAIGIDRSPKIEGQKRKSMVDAMVDLFNTNEELVIMITPEGTRKYQPEWKTGFYRVAQNAQIPITLGYLDFEKKIAGLGPSIDPSGDYEKDLEKIKNFYRDIKGKHPEQGVI